MSENTNLDVVRTAMQKATKPNTMAGLKHTQISTILGSAKSMMAQALPKHLTADRMIQMATTLISRNPDIAECTIESLVGAVMQSSILGFQPVSALGYCYFIPYNKNIGSKQSPKWVKEVQFQIGYKGYLDLARRSKEVLSIWSEIVYKDDIFQYELGLERKLIHKPNLDIDQSDKNIIYVYAVAQFVSGGYSFVILSKQQIESLRLRGPNAIAELTKAWATDYAAMAKAKALKQLSKYLPLSVELISQLASDEQIIKPEDFDMELKTGFKIENVQIPEQLEQGIDDSPINAEEVLRAEQAEIAREKEKEEALPKTNGKAKPAMFDESEISVKGANYDFRD